MPNGLKEGVDSPLKLNQNYCLTGPGNGSYCDGGSEPCNVISEGGLRGCNEMQRGGGGGGQKWLNSATYYVDHP